MKPGKVGRLLRALREGAGLNQSKLSELSGITQGHISKVESGKLVDPGLTVVIAWVMAVDLHLHPKRSRKPGKAK